MTARVETVNRRIMEDLAYRSIFKRPVESEERDVILALCMELEHENFATATELCACVSLVCATSRPTAERLIARAVDKGLLTCEPDQKNLTRKLYRFATGVEDKIAQVNDILLKINAVLIEQRRDPSNTRAGEKNIPADVYFHMKRANMRQEHRDRISERKAVFRKSSVSQRKWA